MVLPDTADIVIIDCGYDFMYGPGFGKLMRALNLDGELKTLDMSMLDSARFKEGRLIQEYNIV